MAYKTKLDRMIDRIEANLLVNVANKIMADAGKKEAAMWIDQRVKRRRYKYSKFKVYDEVEQVLKYIQ